MKPLTLILENQQLVGALRRYARLHEASEEEAALEILQRFLGFVEESPQLVFETLAYKAHLRILSFPDAEIDDVGRPFSDVTNPAEFSRELRKKAWR